MKKFRLKATLVVALAAVAGYGVYTSQRSQIELSDTALANVEALARAELPGGTCWGTAPGGGNQRCYGGGVICCWAHTDVFGKQ